MPSSHVGQGAQLPPQSTPVSSPSWIPLKHDALAPLPGSSLQQAEKNIIELSSIPDIIIRFIRLKSFSY
jgi:hypothetical protein